MAIITLCFVLLLLGYALGLTYILLGSQRPGLMEKNLRKDKRAP